MDRGDCVFDSDHRNVKDGKDHYPINSEDQARNALSRAMQHDRIPKWFDGTLEELRNSIQRAVKKKYPDIEVTQRTRRKPKK